MKTTPMFEIRGLCVGTAFDTYFSWTIDLDQDPDPDPDEYYDFKGISNSIIQWSATHKEWRLTLNDEKTIYGVCNETSGDYPFGFHDWYFFNDTCKAKKSTNNGQISKLQISGGLPHMPNSHEDRCQEIMQLSTQLLGIQRSQYVRVKG